MKPRVILFFLGLVALLSLAAVTVTTSEKLVRIQSEVQTGDVTAFFEKSVTVDGTTYVQPWESVSWNSSDKTVTVNGETKTYHDVMVFVVAIAQQERAAQQQPPAQP